MTKLRSLLPSKHQNTNNSLPLCSGSRTSIQLRNSEDDVPQPKVEHLFTPTSPIITTNAALFAIYNTIIHPIPQQYSARTRPVSSAPRLHKLPNPTHTPYDTPQALNNKPQSTINDSSPQPPYPKSRHNNAIVPKYAKRPCVATGRRCSLPY